MTQQQGRWHSGIVWIGRGLAGGGLFYLFYTLASHLSVDDLLKKSSTFFSYLPLLFLINLLSVLLGIYVWHMLVRHQSTQTITFAQSFYYFMRTEIAKYIPGNVFHLVGRQAMARKLGLSQRQMAKVSLFFSLWIVLATLGAGGLMIFLAPWPLVYKMLIIVVCALLIMVGCRILKRIECRQWFYGIGGIMVSLLLQGAMLACLIWSQSVGLDGRRLAIAAGAYLFSWLLGFVVPGASGGMGVREGAFVWLVNLLHLPLAPSMAAFLMVWMRLVNIMVDLFLFGMTYLRPLFIKKGVVSES